MCAVSPRPHRPPERERRTAEERRDRARYRSVRAVVQFGVVALCVWSVVDFGRFVNATLRGSPGNLVGLRAPGFEAWTPIAALVSLVHWLRAGELDPIHPAGVLILSGALTLAFVVRGGFCGWICPVGTVFDWLTRLGRRLGLRRSSPPPKWLDLPLQGLRWLLLLVFAWGAVHFGDYYYHVFDRYADVEMYGYWAWGRVGLVFLAIAVVSLCGGLVVDRFWCRYLCPYGAFTQLVAKLSPWHIVRRAKACTDCGKCDRVCPALLDVSRVAAVTSSRCIGCGLCVAACPEKRALTAEYRLPQRSYRLGWLLTAALVVLAFAAWPLWGQLTGRWQTSLSTAEYRLVIPRLRDGTLENAHVPNRAARSPSARQKRYSVSWH